MKKFAFILYVLTMIVLGLIGAWIGTYIYKINSMSELKVPILEGMESKDLDYELALMTSEQEDKVSPNAVLIIKTYYKMCGHTLTDYKQIDNKYVNLKKEEFEDSFFRNNMGEYKIENFTSKEITVLKEVELDCKEHYILRAEDGLLVIYMVEENGEEVFFKKTNIGIEYLTKEDVDKLKNGIEVVGDGELNSKLEDYV